MFAPYKYFRSKRRWHSLKQGCYFLVVTPLIGNLLVILMLMLGLDKAVGISEIVLVFLGGVVFFMYGAFFAYLIASVPAFLMGYILYDFDDLRSTRLLLAPIIGFSTMFSWDLLWTIVDDDRMSTELVMSLFKVNPVNEGLYSAVLLGGLAAVSSTILVIVRQQVKT